MKTQLNSVLNNLFKITSTLDRTVKITIGGIPGGGSDVISQRLSLISNLVKDSLIYAFQEALRPSVEELVTGPALSSFLAENLKF